MARPDNRLGLSRTYSEETWRVYDALDVSLAPRGLESLFDAAGPYLASGSRILDAGCRDAKHLIELVRRHDATGVGVDPVELHVERARVAVAEAGLDDRIEVLVGLMEDLPHPGASFDFVWCRDVLEQVAALDAALQGAHRVLKPGGHMLVYSVFASGRLSDEETEMFGRGLGNVVANLDESYVEAAFARAGLRIERKDVIGSEWREHAEENAGGVSKALLRLSRLHRQEPALVERFGRDIVDHVEANLHWETFLLMGKLVPTIYVLVPGG
jgi:ubiquinone/menaquinone biosynthesis C-methylase UbiE